LNGRGSFRDQRPAQALACQSSPHHEIQNRLLFSLGFALL
jgi:hypothetical protein